MKAESARQIKDLVELEKFTPVVAGTNDMREVASS